MKTRYAIWPLLALALGRGALACASNDDSEGPTTDGGPTTNVEAGETSTNPTDSSAADAADASAPLDAAVPTCSKDDWCYAPLPEASTAQSLNGVWVGPDHHAWAVTGDGALLSWNGTTWSEALQIGGNLHAITGTSANDLWIAGDGVVTHITVAAGKLTRADANVDPYTGYTKIAATSNANVWIMATDNNVYRLELPDGGPSDAGLGLTQMILPSDYAGDYSNFHVTALWGSNTDIWIAAQDQTYCDIVACNSYQEIVIRKWLSGNAGDSSWSPRVRLSTDDDGGVLPMYSSITNGLSTSDGQQVAVAASNTSSVVRVTGTTFTVEPLVNYVSTQSMWATSSKDVWLAGPGGIRHWDGTAWQIGRITLSPDAPLLKDLHAISGIPTTTGSDLWSVGDDVAIHRVTP